MPISIPQSVFDKYYDVVDSTFNIFGVTCQLVYIDKVEEISNSFNNLSSNHSVNAHDCNLQANLFGRTKAIWGQPLPIKLASWPGHFGIHPSS